MASIGVVVDVGSTSVSLWSHFDVDFCVSSLCARSVVAALDAFGLLGVLWILNVNMLKAT